MRASAPGTTRARSRSSTRITSAPPAARAASHATSAVRAPPRCKSPVGDGAKRPRIFRTHDTSIRAFGERFRHVVSQFELRGGWALAGAAEAGEDVFGGGAVV